MRYQCPVIDLVHAQALTHLSGGERRLSAALARPRRIAAACIVVLTACGWLALALMASDDRFGALCRPITGGNEFGLSLLMWTAMTLAMMLPTAGPMILTYTEIADTAVSKGEPVASPLVLTAGYLAVWFAFAVGASAMQTALAATIGLPDAGNGTAAAMVGAVLFIGAGLYQFSALKRACLSLCQRPFPFFFANWSARTRGVFELGLRQGLHCLGCCWALMLLMLAAGVMNVVWMAVLGIVMTAEKMSASTRFSHALGVILVATGLGLMAASLLQVS